MQFAIVQDDYRYRIAMYILYMYHEHGGNKRHAAVLDLPSPTLDLRGPALDLPSPALDLRGPYHQ
jgi:hypothetical protein